MKCPSCGTESDGKFCPECGAPHAHAQCARCSAPLQPGARYCTQCGLAARSALGGKVGWYVAAGILVVMLGLVAILEARIRSGAASADQVQPTASGPMNAPFAGGNAAVSTPNGSRTPPPLTGTPRQQADRLFEKIMTDHESGDTAQARFFLPMGIGAYQQAGELDADGLYHLAVLQSAAGEYSDAIATARKILAMNADHLLALGAAAEAAENAGDASAAREYNSHFLRVYDVEKKKTAEEYIEHARVLPQYEQAARTYLKK